MYKLTICSSSKLSILRFKIGTLDSEVQIPKFRIQLDVAVGCYRWLKSEIKWNLTEKIDRRSDEIGTIQNDSAKWFAPFFRIIQFESNYSAFNSFNTTRRSFRLLSGFEWLQILTLFMCFPPFAFFNLNFNQVWAALNHRILVIAEST